ncbi:hypothetical protein [Aquimarina latercula]|uniref:hypothetical protein n=1 Tax=Aquimarina latercula TaxID=987 RepID=UPI0004197DAE|nr:hypothetical protein [Aquimarina latercula]
MKNVYYVLVVLISLFAFSSCESDSIENEIGPKQENIDDSSLNISAIDKEDAETVGTRD